jgi:hypothetical protein
MAGNAIHEETHPHNALLKETSMAILKNLKYVIIISSALLAVGCGDSIDTQAAKKAQQQEAEVMQKFRDKGYSEASAKAATKSFVQFTETMNGKSLTQMEKEKIARENGKK